eukprot:NODE_625_length_5889_cov_0.576339.p2 type:complete len:210 gc:universal NODE_625_length_5889_cov_0.576339:5262-4633(-)
MDSFFALYPLNREVTSLHIMLTFLTIFGSKCPDLKEMVVGGFDVRKAVGNWYQPLAQDPFQKNCKCPVFSWDPAQEFELSLNAQCNYGKFLDTTTFMRQEYTDVDGISKYTETKTQVTVGDKSVTIPINFISYDNVVLYVKPGSSSSALYEEMILYQCTVVNFKKLETIEYYTRYIPTEAQTAEFKDAISKLPFSIYIDKIHSFNYRDC